MATVFERIPEIGIIFVLFLNMRSWISSSSYCYRWSRVTLYDPFKHYLKQFHIMHDNQLLCPNCAELYYRMLREAYKSIISISIHIYLNHLNNLLVGKDLPAGTWVKCRDRLVSHIQWYVYIFSIRLLFCAYYKPLIIIKSETFLLS